MSTMSTSIRRRQKSLTTACNPPLLDSHNALHRSQISNLPRRNKREGESSVASKNLGLAPLFFAPPSFLNLFTRHRARREQRSRSKTQIISFSPSLTHRPTKGRQQSDHDSGRASCLPATDGWMDGSWTGRGSCNGRRAGRRRRAADPSSSCRPY